MRGMKFSGIAIAVLLLGACATSPNESAKAPTSVTPGIVFVNYTTEFLNGRRLNEVPKEVTIVRREKTTNSVVSQIGLNVLLLLASGGNALGVQGSSKDQFRGEPIPDVADRVNLMNPVATGFVQQLADAVFLASKGAPEWSGRSYKKSILVSDGTARLIYENLFGQDESYRLTATMTVFKEKENNSFLTIKRHEYVDCGFESEKNLPLSEWAKDNYILVKNELAAGQKRCIDKVIADLPTLLKE